MLFPLSILLFASLASADCTSDNCLRAFRATQTPTRLQVAKQFCATFKPAAPTGIPSFASSACIKNQNGNRTARIASACACIAASPATTTAAPTVVATPPPSGACALVSSSSSVQKAANPSATPTVAASLARECLNSVPLNKTAAIQLVDSMFPYLEWQSDSAWKKAPPADYFYPPHDIFAYLASVKKNLQADKYVNEYEFQADLYQVFARAHDGHFVFYPDALTKAFEFGRTRSLVSISEDGSSLPVIKIYEDFVVSNSTASVVTEINGVEASKYVAGFAYTASFNQDADAAYNSMFYEKAFVAGAVSNGYFSGGGRMRYIYPGDNTTFTFANGSTLTTENIAKVKGNFARVTNGTTFYQVFCTGPSSRAGVAEVDGLEVEAAEEELVPTVLAPGYPPAVVITSDSVVSGYYLDGAGYEDVAVISLLAFESNSVTEFQSVAQTFFAAAIRDGKKKLVIDLSANGGGYILQGYDLFRQLFPDIVQDGFSRWRESDTLLAISQVYSNNTANFDPSNAPSSLVNQYESFFNYRYDLNLTNQNFQSFADKFAPRQLRGDNFTATVRWNLSDPLTTSNGQYGLGTDVTGYGSRTNFTQPFKAENIIMLQDGYCASTCTLFSEMMRIQAGVKSIAMGGRPKTGPIQGVGGIKGAQILSWTDIYSSAQDALKTATPEQAEILKRLSPYPINRSSSNGINVRDQILRDNVEDGLPAQFVREEADCRLYYTKPMITDVTALWKAAADAAFNGKTCAAGGLSKPKRGLESVPRSKALGGKTKPKVIRKAKTVKTAEWAARHEQKVIP